MTSVLLAAHAVDAVPLACDATLTPYTAVMEGTAPDTTIVSIAGGFHGAFNNTNTSECSGIVIRGVQFDNRALVINVSDAVRHSETAVTIIVEDCAFRNDAALVVAGRDHHDDTAGGPNSAATVHVLLRRLDFIDSSLLVGGLSLRSSSSTLTLRDSIFDRRDGKTLTELHAVLRIPALFATVGPFKWHRDSVTSALHVAGDVRIDGPGTSVRFENLTAFVSDRTSAASWDRDGRVAAAVSIGNSQRGGGIAITGGARWTEDGLYLTAVGQMDDAACRLTSQADVTVAGPGSLLSIRMVTCGMTTHARGARIRGRHPAHSA